MTPPPTPRTPHLRVIDGVLGLYSEWATGGYWEPMDMPEGYAMVPLAEARAGLDVERLARAIYDADPNRAGLGMGAIIQWEELSTDFRDARTREAAAIAAAYGERGAAGGAGTARGCGHQLRRQWPCDELAGRVVGARAGPCRPRQQGGEAVSRIIVCGNCLNRYEPMYANQPGLQIGGEFGSQRDPSYHYVDLCPDCVPLLTAGDFARFHDRYRTERAYSFGPNAEPQP